MKLSELKEINSPAFLDRERKQYACMISYYAALEGANDTLKVFDKCVELAENTDFEMIIDDGELVINTEWARCNAIELVKNTFVIGRELTNEN